MSILSDHSKAVRATVDAIRDNPAGTALARLIVEGMSQARFEGLSEWDQGRYVADLALKAGWQLPVAADEATAADAPLEVGEWVLVTLPPHDPCEQDSGKVGKIVRLDGEHGYIVHFPGKDRPESGLRTVAAELTRHAAPEAAETAGDPAHA